MTRGELLRYEAGLTAKDVAAKADISVNTLRAFERGDTISAPVAKRIAKVYRISVAQLLGVDEPNGAAL